MPVIWITTKTKEETHICQRHCYSLNQRCNVITEETRYTFNILLCEWCKKQYHWRKPPITLQNKQNKSVCECTFFGIDDSKVRQL